MRANALLSRSWMGLLVDLAKVRGTHMRIDLGRRQTFVTKQFLDASNIGSSIEQMSGKAVS